MICVLIGIVPSCQGYSDIVRSKLRSVDRAHVEWRDQSDAEDEGSPTLLLTATTEASVDLLVHSVQKLLQEEIPSAGKGRPCCELWATAPAPLPLRPLDGYGSKLKFGGTSCQASGPMREWGMLLQTRILDADQITELRTKVEFAISNVEALLSSRRPEIAYGKDNFHFREIASRGGERFDLRLLDADAKDFVRQHVFGNPRVTSFLSNALGSPNEIDFDTSVVYSRPGARTQGWHADGDHQRGATDAGWETDGWNARLANAYALCVFIPLIDLDDDVGFTQFWPASHRNRDLMGFGKVAELAQATYDGKCSAGDGIWYDYRLFHRGMPNSSTVVRPVLQVIFKKKWYVEKANYGVEPI